MASVHHGPCCHTRVEDGHWRSIVTVYTWGEDDRVCGMELDACATGIQTRWRWWVSAVCCGGCVATDNVMVRCVQTQSCVG